MMKQFPGQTFQKPTFSKMGRYISTKILGQNPIKTSIKHNSSVQTISEVQNVRKKPIKTTFSRSPRNPKNQMSEMPPVGHYKINFNQIEKYFLFLERTPQSYNFNRSIPHFSREKYHCYEVQFAFKSEPDINYCKGKIKGLIEMNRIIGRKQAKFKSQFITNLNENRFDNYSQRRSSSLQRIDLKKFTTREQHQRKNEQTNLQYQCNHQVNKKRLATHCVPFMKQLSRNMAHIESQTGISENFALTEEELPFKRNKEIEWNLALSRNTSNILPCFMDKSINSRLGISSSNLKALEMNCTNLKKQYKQRNDKKRMKVVKFASSGVFQNRKSSQKQIN